MSQYDKLFEKYVLELTDAVFKEKERLDRIKQINRDKFHNEEKLEVWVESGFGSLSTQGRIIAVFRKYWLKCDELNEANQENDEIVDNEDEYIDYVNPRDFVVDWLEGTNEELYVVINSMPYYPIGIDEEGNYC